MAVTGTSGDDRDPALFGGAGDDTVQGFAGDDFLSWSGGNDVMDGGDGIDVVLYEFDFVSTGVVINNTAIARGGVGAFSVRKADRGIDRLIGVENVHGSQQGDVIFLGDGVEENNEGAYSFDRAGDDLVTGGRFGSSFYAGSGSDRYVGLAGTEFDGGDAVWWIYFRADEDGGDLAGRATRGVRVTFTGEYSGFAIDGWGDRDSFTGIDGIIGSDRADTLTGGDAGLTLRGEGGDDRLTGGESADSFHGGEGADTIAGGGGVRDELRYDRDARSGGLGGVTVNLATGRATDGFGDIDLFSGIERVRGTAQNDVFVGDGERNRFRGGDGADRYDGGGGVDEVDYSGDSATRGVSVNLATGRATDGFGRSETLARIENIGGTRFADTLTGDAENNFFRSNGGNDVLAGGGGFDYASFDGDGPVTANLATGRATGGTGAGAWTVRLSGFEELGGGSGRDSLTGDAGRNTLEGRAGADTLTGGAEFDIAIYQFDEAQGNMRVDLGAGFAIDPSGARDVLRGIEGVRAAGGDDSLRGSGGDDVFYGVGGNDTIAGLGGFDEVVYFSDERTGGTAGVLVNLATGRAIDGFGDTDVLSGVEGVLGTMRADTLIGGAAAETFNGFAGADVFDGGAGIDTVDYGFEDDFRGETATRALVVNLAEGFARDGYGFIDDLTRIEHVIGGRRGDRMTGGAGAETLEGGAGNDTIVGGGGADRLVGGASVDRLTGGAGPDRFVWTALADSGVATPDEVTDFQRGSDRIDLSAIDADTDGTPGNQAFRFIGAAAFGGADGQLRFAGGRLSGDVNGDRIADFAIALTGVAALTAADIVL